MKILNFGSLNIDNVYQVAHFLQPGETLSAAAYNRFPGGKGFNQTLALARACASLPEVSLFHAGHIGPDGSWLAELLRSEGVDTSLLSPVDTPTGHAIIQVDPAGQNCILIEGGANQTLSPDDVRDALARAGIGPGDVVLLQNETSATADILRLASATGAHVVFNAAPMSPDVLDLPLELVNLLIVNEVEGAALAHVPAQAEKFVLFNSLRETFPKSDILLTLGSEGCLYGAHLDRANCISLPARSVRAIDTTAAGDTFIGYFLAAQAKGLEPRLALDHATAASAYCVAHAGAAPSIPHPSDLATPWDRTILRGMCNKTPVSYRVGEPITFYLSFEFPPFNSDPAFYEDYTIRWVRKGDDGITEEGSFPAIQLRRAPVSLRFSLACPGFLSLTATLHGPDGRPVTQPVKPGQYWDPILAFNGGAGAELYNLHPEPEPADFDAFWTQQRARLDSVPLSATRTPLPSPTPGVQLYAVEIACPGPRPVTGYLSIPDAPTPLPAKATFQGYGHHIPIPPTELPTDTIQLAINAHGVALGRDPEYYNDFFLSLFSNGYSYGFDPEQNKDPQNAYFCAMALRVLRTLQYLKSLPEWNRRDLITAGGSQGALQSIWGAALDHDVSAMSIEVPWCCDLAGINTNRIASPWHIPYVPGIDYFDPVHHARRVKCTTTILRAGLGDYTCPPSGIALFFYQLHVPRSIRWVQGSTHGYVPPKPNQIHLL